MTNGPDYVEGKADTKYTLTVNRFKPGTLLNLTEDDIMNPLYDL